MRIAVLGATSHVGKNIVEGLLKSHELFLYARNLAGLHDFLTGREPLREVATAAITTFKNTDTVFDAIVNCIGFGAPEKLESSTENICRLTEEYDNVCMDYLQGNRRCTYIFVSSGAVYGEKLSHPINGETVMGIAVNNMTRGDAYRIAKVNAEIKHRMQVADSIFDLRLFGFFSRFIDTSSKYLLSQIIFCVKNRVPFVTNTEDFVRDYVHPKDLNALIDLCLASKGINTCLDIYSKSPIRKTEILEFFCREHGLQLEYGGHPDQSPTGRKSFYYSDYNRAGDVLGFSPIYTSLDTLRMESAYLVNQKSDT